MAYDAQGRYIPDQMGMAGPQGQLTNQDGWSPAAEEEYYRNMVSGLDFYKRGKPPSPVSPRATDGMSAAVDVPVGVGGPQEQLKPMPNQGGFFNTKLPQQPTGTMPATGVNPLTGMTVGSTPSTGAVAGGLALGGLLGGNFNLGDFGSALGSYYEGQQALQGAQQVGQAALGTAGALGQQAVAGTEFKPFTVTSSLARAGTTPQGGYTLELSPQQQALQEQLLGQAQGLFGQVGQDPAAQQAALYEQIRATQRPEEERQQALLQERLFAGGRGGLQTAQYGGSPEQFAYEKARQEAMAGASLSARNQALAEQQQALAGATGLLGAGYSPQQQALSALGYGTDIAGTGQRAGASLQGQLGQSGLEGYLQGADLANRLQLAQQQALMSSALGTGTQGGGVLSGLADSAGGWLSSLFSPSSSQGINNIGSYLSNYIAPSSSMIGTTAGTDINNMGGFFSQLIAPSSSMYNVTTGSGSFSDFDGDGIDDELDSYPYDPTRG
jgi:hypothetical protein